MNNEDKKIFKVLQIVGFALSNLDNAEKQKIVDKINDELYEEGILPFNKK